MKQIQQIESREDLRALIEGDLVDTQQGIMVYTELNGEPRIIKQFDDYRILSARIDGSDKSQIEFDQTLNKLKITKGSFVDIFSNHQEYGWIQYSIDQEIMNKSGFFEVDKRVA
ncbi:MAG: hypothetical protein AABX03_02835 [Nanoarchaeota archaeon]